MKKIISNTWSNLTASEKKKSWWLAIADVLVSLLDIIFLIAVVFLVKFYTEPAHLHYPVFILNFFTRHALLPITVFFILFAIKNAVGFMVSSIQYRFVYAVASRISKQLMLQYLNGSYTEYVKIDSSVVNRAISQQPIEFAHYVLSGLQQVFSQSMLILFTVTAVLILNPFLFPLLVLLLIPPVLLVSLMLKRKLKATGTQGKEASEKNMQHLQEALNGFVESNIYGRNTFFTNRYHRFQLQLNRYLSDRLIIQNIPPRLMEIFAVFGLLLLIAISTVAGKDHALQLVSVGALMVAAYKIIPGIVKITNTINQVKLYAFTAEGLAIPQSNMPVNDQGSNRIETISFNNISFGYPGKVVLSSFCTSIHKGDFVILSGVSGKGKTSLVHLLLGFLSPSVGTIAINGVNLKSGERRNYWNRIAYVKQQNFFLHAPVLENITLQEEDLHAGRIKCILSRTGVEDMMKHFPDGLQTMVTENGKNFSGGQRQRMAFARALYKDFDLLVLDEPFNELDEAAEKDMLLLLQELAEQGKIVLLVTHNQSAMQFANKKIALDG